jgi:hypothetical protein
VPDGFAKARSLVGIAAGLLLVAVLLGVPPDGKVPYFDFTLVDRSHFPLVLSGLLVFGAFRLAIEWGHLTPERRATTAAKADLGLTLALAAVALAVFIFRTTGIPQIGWRPAALSLFLAGGGYMIGQVIGLAIWSSPFIRPAAVAHRLGLPRVPVAVRSSFLAAAIIVGVTILGLGAWLLVWPTSFARFSPLFLVSFGIAVASNMVDLVRPTRRRADGSRQAAAEFRARLQAVYDHHDSLYRMHGGMPAEEQDPSELFAAAAAGDLDAVRQRLLAGDDPDQRENFGWTPLMIACANQHLHIVRHLLQEGASPNHANTLGRTPLMFAARYGNMEIVNALLEAGADVNLQPLPSEPPALYAAATHGHAKVAEVLLTAGADPLRRDLEGRTALEVAQASGHGHVAAVLRRAARHGHDRSASADEA